MLLKFAIQEFLTEKRYENLAKPTIQTYEFTFRHLERFFLSQGLELIEDITPLHCKRYIRYCMDTGDKPTTINNRIKRAKTLWNWCVSEEIVEVNPFKGARKVREDVKIHAFTNDEVKQILSHLRRVKRRENSLHSMRNHTIFLTLISTGIRLGELVNMKWNDIDFETKTLTVYGKSRTQQTVPLTSQILKELALWKAYCEGKFYKLSPSVWVNQSNQPITGNAVKLFFKRLANVMSFPQTRCSAHTCRHYYAKSYIEQGGEIVSLARILRHTSIKTTERYLTFFSNELQESNERFNPLNKLY